MTRFHISEDGMPRACNAKPGNCPIAGSAAHGDFDSVQDAMAFAEEYNAKAHERDAFLAHSKKTGDSMRQHSVESGLDDFAGLSPEEIEAALTNPGKPIQFAPDGSLLDSPSGTLQDPYDLAGLTGDQAKAYLLSKGYDPERIAKLEADFKGVPPEKDLSERALITAATVDLMVGPPQGHVRFSQDPHDDYSFSMSNFADVGLAVGMLQTQPDTGFIIPVKDPKASLSWMQVSNPANNVFLLQKNLGINRLFMPQTANSGVTGEARKKLDDVISYVEANKDVPTAQLMARPEFARLTEDISVKAADVAALQSGKFTTKDGREISKDDYVKKIEINGADWMAREFRESYGLTTEKVQYGNAELSQMKPTQSGISVLQVQGMAQGTINEYIRAINKEESEGRQITPARSQEILDSVMGKRTLVTEDGYIIDGHHGLAKAALLNSMIKNGSFGRQMRAAGLSVPEPTEAHLGVMKINMDGGQAFDAVTYWTESKGFPVSGMA